MLLDIRRVLKSVTVEPVMVLYYVSLALTNINGQNLLLRKACNPGETAPAFDTECNSEVDAQKLVTGIQTWKQLVLLFGPVFFVLFAGPWSDNHGKRRKPLIWLPLCGQILSDLLCMLNVYFWSWSPQIAALSESVLPALTGWRSCFIVGVYSYMSDTTSEKSRTVRLGICAAIYFLGTPIGTFVFGLVFRTIGFYGVYLVCVVSNAVALFYLLIFVNESEPDISSPQLRTWEGLIDPKSAIQSLKTVLKPREGFGRAIILITILAGPVSMAPLQGEFMVLYFFLRYKFYWDETAYGFYAAYRFSVVCLGTLITLGVFSRLLRISDAVIGLMSSVTLTLAALGYAFCNMTWELFLFPVIDFMQGAGLAVVTSIVSKNVERTELGQVISMIGVSEAIFPLINLPLYNQVYKRTFSQWPGFFFLLSAVYGVLGFILFSSICVLQKKNNVRKKELEKTMM